MSPERRYVGDSADDGETEVATAPPNASEAFQALGGATRVAVVRALAGADPKPFAALFDATDEDTSAGFAYHLRQLTGRFVRQRADDRYELTDAGRAAARALASGAFTERVDRDPVALEDACPVCGDERLVADVTDNVAEVACGGCEASLLRLSLPPSGYAERDGADLAAALDGRFRRRVETVTDGVCPDCAGAVEATTEIVGDADGDADSQAEGPPPIQATFACETCEATVRCPVTLAVLDHPAVVAFYHDHGEDVRDRPVWNVGDEWRERLVSRDPWCVQVSARLDGEELRLYVAADTTVVDYRRRQSPAAAEPSDDRGGDDDPDGGEARPVETTAADDAGESAGEDPGEFDHSAAADGATA